MVCMEWKQLSIDTLEQRGKLDIISKQTSLAIKINLPPTNQEMLSNLRNRLRKNS